MPSPPKIFEDAIRTGALRASKALKNVKSDWIENQEAIVDDESAGVECPPDEGHFYPGIAALGLRILSCMKGSAIGFPSICSFLKKGLARYLKHLAGLYLVRVAQLVFVDIEDLHVSVGVS